MHVLITGGAGFIGSHLAEYHLAKGDKVHVVDDLSTGSLQNIAAFQEHPDFRFDECDILIWSGLDKAVAWADRIYHMAAIVGMFKVLAEPIRVLAINIASCERVLRAAAMGGWRPRIIIASSSEVYGHSLNFPLNENDNLIIESAINPKRNYAIGKLADEAMALAYNHKNNIPVTPVRLFNTIGPRQTGRYGMVVPRFIQQACDDAPITIFGDGMQTRSFCDVRDIVVALDALANNESTCGQIINVGNDHEISINELAELVRLRANSSSEIHYVSYKDAYQEDYVDVKRRKPDIRKLIAATNLKFQWSLEKTIDDLVERYMKIREKND